MNKIDSALVRLLRRSLNGEDSPDIGILSLAQWQEIYRQAAVQGILALLWHAIERLHPSSQPPREIRLQWAYSVDRIRIRYRKQWNVATELAEAYAAAGIRTVVLKGLALSRYYPIPEYRECGDFDCFLCGAYERGNRIARSLGASVDDRSYRHSHIEYNGLLIENHRFCMTVRGDRNLKRLEKEIQRMAIDNRNETCLRDTKLILPPAQFHALFLTQHALHHFLVEGITLRHLCDWGMFLKHETADIDWTAFDDACRDNDMLVFADAMTAICTEKLGIELPDSRICQDSECMEPIWHDILRNRNNTIYDKGLSLWGSRFATLKNIYRQRWKYDTVYGRDYRKEVLRSVYGILFEANI